MMWVPNLQKIRASRDTCPHMYRIHLRWLYTHTQSGHAQLHIHMYTHTHTHVHMLAQTHTSFFEKTFIALTFTRNCSELMRFQVREVFASEASEIFFEITPLKKIPPPPYRGG